MNTVKNLSFAILALGAISAYAQTTLNLEGNVNIKDDPTTETATEGNLTVAGTVQIISAPSTTACVTGTNAIAIGKWARATGDQSIAIANNDGYAQAFSQYGVSIGDHGKSGTVDEGGLGYNFAYGRGASATKGHSVALGLWSVSSGGASYALGNFAKASNGSSVAIGNTVTASGFGSVALGHILTSSGSYSASCGARSAAIGNYSAVFGHESNANHHLSFTLGMGLETDTVQQVVIGTYNELIESIATWNVTTPLFVIGNGRNASNRSNALVMLKNGDTNLNGKFTAKEVVVKQASGGISMGEFCRAE